MFEDPFTLQLKHILFDKYKYDKLPKLPPDYYWGFSAVYYTYYLNDSRPSLGAIICTVDLRAIECMTEHNLTNQVKCAINHYESIRDGTLGIEWAP